jgi:hypothetical protein
MKSCMEIPQNLKIDIPYDPAILLLGIYPKECNLGFNIDTCTHIFIAALFTIAKVWKQCRCTTTDPWNKKMWYIDTVEYYLAIKEYRLCHLQVNGWNWVSSEIS